MEGYAWVSGSLPLCQEGFLCAVMRANSGRAFSVCTCKVGQNLEHSRPGAAEVENINTAFCCCFAIDNLTTVQHGMTSSVHQLHVVDHTFYGLQSGALHAVGCSEQL